MNNEEIPNNWIQEDLNRLILRVEKVNPKEVFENNFLYVDISSINSARNKIEEPKQLELEDAPSRARQLIKLNDILISTVRPNLRRIAPVDIRYHGQIASTGFCVLRIHPNIDWKYVYYFTISKAFTESLVKLQRGVSYPAVRNSDIYLQKIPLAPLAEQKRIVAKLDRLFGHLDQLKERLERIPKLLEDFRQSVLTQAVTGKLTEEWRGAGNIENWESLNLSEVSKSITDGDHVAPPKTLFGIPFVVISNLSAGFIDLGLVTRFVSEAYFAGLKEKRKPRKGDVLYTVTGSYGIAVLIEENRNFAFQRHIGIIKPDLERITSKYLYYYLCSNLAKRQADQMATGTAQKTVSLSSLRSFQIMLPLINEQKEIVRITDSLLSRIQPVREKYKQIKAQIELLPQSILSKAFRGELIKQNLSDESARLLIEQIQLEKEKVKKESKMPTEQSKRESQSPQDQDLISVFIRNGGKIRARDLWKQSKYSNDIDAFYEELKKIEHELEFVKGIQGDEILRLQKLF